MKNSIPSRPALAGEIMSRPVKTVYAFDPVSEAARLFSENAISAAMVVDKNGQPLGVITKTDVINFDQQRDGVHVAERDKADEGGIARGFHEVEEADTVEHWMTPVIFSVPVETTVHDIARRMVKYGTHHMFVRGASPKQILGIISSFDLLRLL